MAEETIIADENMKLLIAYKDVFSSPNGKKVLESLKIFAGYNTATMPFTDGGAIDPLAVMRNEGKRAVLIHIETMLNKDLNKPQQKDAK